MHVGAVAVEGGHFGAGDGDIFLSNVQCSGDEEKLTDCLTSHLGQHTCSHASDAGVVCQCEYSKMARCVSWLRVNQVLK